MTELWPGRPDREPPYVELTILRRCYAARGPMGHLFVQLDTDTTTTRACRDEWAMPVYWWCELLTPAALDRFRETMGND
jgi:hypothetical protein